MSLVTDSTLYWAVLARSRGEVLAAETESGGVHLGMFGAPGGLTQQETQAWLGEVIGVACESAASGPSGLIPSLLHHAMTGLIFTHAELWERGGGGQRACSYVFAQAGDRVGFGWIGDADVDVWVDGEPCDVAWITIRDESGAEGRAWCIDSDRTVQVRLVWNAPGDDAMNGGEAEAVWTAATMSHAPAMLASSSPLLAEPVGPVNDVVVSEAPADSAVEMETIAGAETEIGERPDEADVALSLQSDATEETVASSLPAEGALDAVAAEDSSQLSELAEHAAEASPSVETPAREGPGRWMRKTLAWLGGLGKSRPVQPALHEESGAAEAEEFLADSAEPAAAAQIESQEFDAVQATVDETMVADQGANVGSETAAVEISPSEMEVADSPIPDEAIAAEPAAVPDLIPPTPEPAAVTQQAVPLTPPSASLAVPVATDEQAPRSGKKKGRGEMFAPTTAPPAPPAASSAPPAEAIAPAPVTASPAAPQAAPAPASMPRALAPPVPLPATPAAASPPASQPQHTVPPSTSPATQPAPPAATAPPSSAPTPVAPQASQSAAPTVPSAPQAAQAPPTPPPPAAPAQSAPPVRVTPPQPPAPSAPAQPMRVTPPQSPAPEVRSDPAIEDRLDDPAIGDAPAEVSVPTEAVVQPSSAGATPPPPAHQPAMAPEDEEFDFDAAIADIIPMIPQDPAIADASVAEIPAQTTPVSAEPVAAPVQPAAPVPAPEKHGPRTARPRHPSWPSKRELQSAPPAWRKPWVLVTGVMVLFLGGWLFGAVHETGRVRATDGSGAFGGALQAIGLGGPRFTVNANSSPPGAWISVDGKALTLRTPATLSLSPGEHTVRFSFADLGGADFTVRGLKGDRMPLVATLWGALEIYSPNEVGVISVMVDGEARGQAPVRVDSLSPGVHEVRFSAPGTAPWGQTVDIHVGETRELLARANPSPSRGLLQVQASMTDEQGTQPIRGGQVYIDGDLRGPVPLTLDLPRGPHSVRFLYKDIQAPIQVIDLPGGNQRFSVFELGLDREWPRLVMEPPRIARDRPSVVSVSLSGILPGEISGMWLHTQSASGGWRKYDMTLIKAAGGVVGVAVFPISAFDGHGVARYYSSAGFVAGDEAFTEIRTLQIEKTIPDR